MQLIEGTHKEQYAKLWGHMEELRIANSGSIVIMKLQEGTLEQGEPRFERFYVCLRALKEGFKSGCRPFCKCLWLFFEMSTWWTTSCSNWG